MRPSGREGAGTDQASSSGHSSRPGSPPTCAACRPILIARTDALSATLLTSDTDPQDHEFLTGERTAEGYYVVRHGMDPVIKRALAYAPFADLMWFETATPDMDEARRFAEAVHAEHPGQAAGLQLLALVQLAPAPRR